MIRTQKDGRRTSVFTNVDADIKLTEMIKGLSEDERQLLMALQVEEAAETKKLERDLIKYYYVDGEPSVSMEQFIEDPYYLGESTETLYPALREDAIELFNRPYQECLLTGSIGAGKTFLGSIAVCRILYELSRLISPQRSLGMSPGTEIIIPLISKNLILARDVMKTAVDDKIRLSPYFMTKFAPNIKKEYTEFPNNIKVVVGSYTSERVLGTNMYTAFLDETNFPPKRSGQQIVTGFGQKKSIANYDIVEKVYRTLVRRIKSRFQKAGGGFAGMIILASSAATVDSFTERKMRVSKEDPHVFVRDHTQWTVKPEGSFCGEKFYVLCSKSSMKSRILKEEEYDSITDEYLEENEYWIIDVPIEFREDFETDLENAMRDIAGISTQAISAFIQRPERMLESVDASRVHPFSVYEWTSGHSKGKFQWHKMVNQFERKLPGGYSELCWSPIINPKALRWCHIDASLSGDSTGFAVGHIDRFVEVLRRGEDGEQYTEIAPYYIIDFMLRINPPHGEQIYFPDIRTLLYRMLDKGYKFIGLSSDRYEHAELHQQVKQKGIKPYLISMDTTTEPYEELKHAIYEKRINYYEYNPFLEEMKFLEYDRLSGKINHPPGGSKDCSDAVAGVIHGLNKNASRMPITGYSSEDKKAMHEYSWVSSLVPADSKEAADAKNTSDYDDMFLPIILGD